MNNVLATRLLPLIKYPGGKEKELNYIIPALPAKIDNQSLFLQMQRNLMGCLQLISIIKLKSLSMSYARV